MAYSYHKPTRDTCEVCEQLAKADKCMPVIDTYAGRASSSNGYPFHDWYNFVLGYTPTFPEYMLKREGIKPNNGQVVMDPFVGSGTTQLVCKLNKIPSYGIDANDFMVFAALQKLNWNIDTTILEKEKIRICNIYKAKIASIDLNDDLLVATKANQSRPQALDIRYISDKPLIKINILKEAVNEAKLSAAHHDLFMFAISAILVPVSNVRYGPGFGVGKQKPDVDVMSYFIKKVDLIIKDLLSVSEEQRQTLSETILGDSRHLSDYFAPESVDLMITSPPYPGDHEYTKHSKLELIFNGYATDLSSFRTIKKRMIRGSTTNIYKEDNDKKWIENINGIKTVTNEIDQRLKNDGATSGFEKLYTKLIWEYFGGMAMTLSECLKVLKPGGKIALLVSDSHAFKMVHIKTAELLAEVAKSVGFCDSEIILWQMKNSTSHKYKLRENILILKKP
ncbi:MAG: hypothetical protein IKA08_02825 [Alphaproteobacteria bacterium]|nr:hypothetical protein [Alphaproteobacteria bacterium]